MGHLPSESIRDSAMSPEVLELHLCARDPKKKKKKSLSVCLHILVWCDILGDNLGYFGMKAMLYCNNKEWLCKKGRCECLLKQMDGAWSLPGTNTHQKGICNVRFDRIKYKLKYGGAVVGNVASQQESRRLDSRPGPFRADFPHLLARAPPLNGCVLLNSRFLSGRFTPKSN